IGYGVMTEVPAVVVNVQRGGPSTGLPTSVAQGDVMQARWGTHGEHSIITLTASNLQQVFNMTVEAFNLAETYRTPVILLLDEVLGHMREKVVIPDPGEIEVVDRLYTSVPRDVNYHPYLAREDGRLPMSDFGAVHRYNVTGLYHDMWGFPTNDPKTAYDLLHHLVDKLENRSDTIARYREFYTDDAETLLISYGSAARSAMQLVEERRARGGKIGLLELQTLWPFPKELVRRQCERRRHVIVVEMNMGQIYKEVKKNVAQPGRVFLANRFDGVFISPNDIRHVLNVVKGKGV
ncbi:MAG: 2-oxoacid:acceptor oxidoreductase subunit alpha, partial [Deltaproteobacteria bacterium]|nr:2-oxoacid:acceptor oxidoreductase subunit alpha [Deltaproteobacteria bacterium]